MTEGVNASNSGTNNLNGGVLSVNEIVQGAGNGYINFNGGTLKPVNGAFASTFLNGLSAANVRNGGAVIDNNGFGITIGQALLHSSLAGDSANDGGLTVTNSGTAGSLTLTNVNTYNGPTTVKAGAYLAITTRSTGGGSYTVNDASTLEVQVPTAGGQLAMSSLTEGTVGNLTNVFTLGANASTTTPAVSASGTLTVNGTVVVNVTGSSFAGPNIYPLISYGSLSGAGTFVAGTLPAVSGYVVSLTNDTTAKKVELVLATPPPSVSWAVGSGSWDTTTFNWIPLGGGSATNYFEGAFSVFDDSASGLSPITVTLAANRMPVVVTNNSTKNYVLAGSFNLITPLLTKGGNGILTLDNGGGNTFGSILISGGTLQVGNADAGGSLGTGVIANNGTLKFNRTDSVISANIISGTGGVTQAGTGVVTLSGADTYTGNTVINAGRLAVTTANTGAGNYTVADGGSLEVQVAASGASLMNNNLTLGTSGTVTNIFTVGTFASATIPAMQVNGTLALNGAVAVIVSGSGLTSGTYLLMSYGSISGSGSFVLVGAPQVNGNAITLFNDTGANQLKLVVTPVSSLTWDAGNTANGTTLDPASGTWDMNLADVSWNDNGVNRPWVNAVAGIFGGADGTYAITLATNVSATSLTFSNSGYAVSATAPENLTLASNGSGAVPNLKVDAGKVDVIGANVTLQTTGNNNIIMAGPGGTTFGGGELDINSGGIMQHTGGGTMGLVGVGTTLTVNTGGIVRMTGNLPFGFLLGSLPNDNCTMNVNGGTAFFAGGVMRIGGNGTAGNVTGTLNINAGSFSMSITNATVPMTLGVKSGNLGTNNLNGGTESVNQIVKGDPGATAVMNFNGGTLRAVNGALGANFLTGLDAANVRNSGAIIDNNGFNLTVGQAMVHSTIVGDNATDGGLTSSGTGSLTLSGACTYTGNTTISAGRLALSGSGSIANSASIVVAASATFDVSAVTFALGSGQVLSNRTSTATLVGNVDASTGAISLSYGSGTPSFAVTNGTLTLSGSTVFKVNNTGSALAVGNYKLVATNTTGAVAGTLPSVVVSGSGVAAGASTSLQVINGELYLVVASSQPPVITGISINGVTLNLTANNGAANGDFILWQSTNIALPFNQWTPVLTNSFDGSGNLNLSTNIIIPGTQQQFFRISQ
ncbi:MAG: autotransporter-associated beta strand repeat-containing protein [Verrucomicrobia bacterium]|nr:autotransporter-associated beta strand repeat-containing protein [Verrucomicrobiota bacterium]